MAWKSEGKLVAQLEKQLAHSDRRREITRLGLGSLQEMHDLGQKGNDYLKENSAHEQINACKTELSSTWRGSERIDNEQGNNFV
uniref:Uncharacterized protein n=1 Tax=Cucumis melo TaxID=3656 RepID=A0A9I9DW86_CUCME